MTNPEPLTQGDFTITVGEGTQVTIGDKADGKNRIVFGIEYKGAGTPLVRVTVTIRCGQDEDGSTLLAATTDHANVTSKELGDLSKATDTNLCTWQSGTRGYRVTNGNSVTVEISGFVCSTPPGDAQVDVLVRTKNAATDPVWKPTDKDPQPVKTVKIKKHFIEAAEPKVHYFRADPPFVLYGGDTQVMLVFLTTACETVRLYRNNQVVPHQLETYDTAEFATSNAEPPASVGATLSRIGMDYTLLTNAQITGARFWRSGGSDLSTRQLQLFSTASQALLATSKSSDESAGTGWIEVTFPTPVDLVAGAQVTICYDETAYGYTSSGPTLTNAAHTSWQTGRLGTAGSGFPQDSAQPSNYFVDIKVRRALRVGGDAMAETATHWDARALGDAMGTPKVVAFIDKPSITTTYRLVAQGKSELPPIDRTVQVAASGWNRLALPLGYLTQLFVAPDTGEGKKERLYGIFVGANGTAALYSSSTGIDDWRHEEATIPDKMEQSPGVTFGSQIWLVGGSAVDRNVPGDKVWCYEPNADTLRYTWTKKASFPPGMNLRAGHACVVVPVRRQDNTIVEELWVIGGYKNGTVFNDVWKLSSDATSWVRVGQPGKMPKCYRHAATVWKKSSAPEESAEVWIFGGTSVDENLTEIPLKDLWACDDKGEWSLQAGPVPGPGNALAAALVTMKPSHSSGSERLFLAATFLPDNAPTTNVTFSRLYEWQPRNKIWEVEEVGHGWDRFEGSEFYMQAVSFNDFLFVWSMHREPDYQAPPRLNVLISS